MKFEELKTAEEVVDAVNEIGFENKRRATKILEKALQDGIKFSGDDIAGMVDLCTEESLVRALHFSADQFTQKDLEDLYTGLDDAHLIEVALKYNIPIPEELAEVNEALICPDTGAPITWERFYANYDNWPIEYAKARFGALTSYGSEEEIVEVLYYLFHDDQKSAHKYVCKLLDCGITFAGDNLIELTFFCDKLTVAKVVRASQKRLTSEVLEDLLDVVEDSLIIEMVRKQHLQLPEALIEEKNEEIYQTRSAFSKEELIEAYNYVLECLVKAHEQLMVAYKLSVADMSTDRKSVSIAKHAMLLEAQPHIDEARRVLEEIESPAQGYLSAQNTRLNMGKWIAFSDVWGDNVLTDWMVQKRIRKMVEAVERAHKEVKILKSKL